MAKSKGFTGKPLVPSAAIADDFERGTLILIRKMCAETKRELKALFHDPAYALDKADDDGNPASGARIVINRLVRKYEPLFKRWAKKSSRRMVDRSLKHASVQLKGSLKDVGEAMTIQPYFMNDRLREITTASAQEAADLIKLIPQKYLSEVAGQTMRSITSGKGMADLIPYLNDKYGQNIRHARLVAHDQTRKTFTNISRERAKAAGIEEFEWRHSSGGRHPRKLHQELNGQVFRLDDPPYIGDMYGKKVYGLPSELPNCRCFMRLKVNFGDKSDD